ncbi:MAG: polyprenyl synthetase family protein [Candidatus Neomarinimicrobiota bacterium]
MPVTDQFLKLIADLHRQVETGLAALQLPAEPRYLYEPLRYALAGKAKRLRPILVRLAGEACGADPVDLLNAGLAVELLHNFTLVHDDIMDSDDRRHGQATVYRKWDESTAILAGDGIFAFSQLLIGRVKVNPLQCFLRFNQATLAICEGQAYDKEFETAATVGLDQYLTMVAKKTGNLLGLCAELGALLGDQPAATCQALYDYGLVLGQAFQVQDDILEITADSRAMGKSLGSDIAAGKQTVLTILARERNQAEWQLFRSEHSDMAAAQLCAIYRDYFTVTGILAHSRELAGELVRQALVKLQVIPEERRGDLLAFSELVLNRKK